MLDLLPLCVLLVLLLRPVPSVCFLLRVLARAAAKGS
jgi:hypothetical protein